MELYVPEYASHVVELWQSFITQLINILLNRAFEENVSNTSCHQLLFVEL